jgi:type IV secretory pathway VirB9-like protein
MVDLNNKNVNKAKKENKESNVPIMPQESLLNCMNMTNSSIILRSEHQKEYLWYNTMNTDETEAEGMLKS